MMDRTWLAHYEPGVPETIDVPDYPITRNLVRNAELYPEHPALIYGNVF